MAGSETNLTEWSSGHSFDDEPIDLTDCLNADDNNAQSELLYLQYRQAKRRFRKFSGQMKGRHRPTFRKYGKGGKRNKGKGKGKHHSYFGNESDNQPDQRPLDPSGFQWDGISDDYYVGWQEFAFATGKGKSGGKPRGANPIGKDGNVLLCSICSSDQHLRNVCPQRAQQPTQRTHFAAPAQQPTSQPASSSHAGMSLDAEFNAFQMPGLYSASVPHYFLGADASIPDVQYIHADGTVESVDQPHLAEH